MLLCNLAVGIDRSMESRYAEAIHHAEIGDVTYFTNVSIDVMENARSPNGFSVLDRAVMENKLECCRKICERCPQLLGHRSLVDQTTVLMHAAWYGNSNVVQVLLDTIPNAGLQSESFLRLTGHSGNVEGGGKSALHWAVRRKHLEVAKMLMEADPRGGLNYGVDDQGNTPLLMAMHALRDDPVYEPFWSLILDKLPSQCLIKTGENDWTALHIAADKSNVNAVTDILQHCPECALESDLHSQNFLHIAVGRGHFGVVKYAVEQGKIARSVLNAQDINGNTPLHFAAIRRDVRLTKYLLGVKNVETGTVNTRGQEVQDAVLDLDRAFAGVLGIRDRVNEKQLKAQSDFDLVVSALIAAVSFAAGITIPGGYITEGSDQGMALFWKKASFNTFVVSNTIALLLSLYAVFSHFCSRWLKKKKDIELQVTLAMSCTLGAILAMVVAFVTGSYAILSISQGLSYTVTALCGLFFFPIFWASWKVIRQVTSPATSGQGLPTINAPPILPPGAPSP